MKHGFEKNPLIVMTAVTGKPSKEKIFAYLDELSENGIYQALLYPRSGCELEYMSEEWFQRIGYFLEGAKEKGMSIWLYDDFNWPSGDAAGRVSAIPEYRLKAIRTRGANAGEIVAHSNHNAHLFGEKHFPDLMSHQAVDYFISLTHEEYFRRFSDYFGNVIVGIFTDEASIGYCCRAASNTTERPTTLFDTEEGLMPYYEGLKEDYFTACGRSFDEDVKNGHGDLYSVCVPLLSARFKTCYIDKLTNWCRSHRIIMTGHLWRDDTPFHSTKSNGDFLANLSGFMMPGLDEYRTDFRDHRELSLLAAAQYAKGESGAMIELFALGPCDMTYEKRICSIFLSACFGIDHYFLAISPLDMRGNYLITDFFNCFTADQPDFSAMRIFAERANEASAYADMHFTPDVYIQYPYPICAKHYADDFGEDAAFTSLLNELSKHQIQWKFATEATDHGNIPVISFDESMNCLCDGVPETSPSEICRRYQKVLRVTDRNGNAPDGIFVRSFDNGKTVVLNLFSAADTYLIDGSPVFLPEHGVWLSDNASYRTLDLHRVNTDFKLRYLNDNLNRLMFLNGTVEAEIECDTEMSISLSVRKDTEAELDGASFSLTDPESVIPSGMKEFYRSASDLKLSRGTHTVMSDKEYKYLPSVFVSGDFSVETSPCDTYRILLKKRRTEYRTGERFSDYGRIEFIGTADVPHNAEAIELSGTTLYTLIYLDGQLIGECISSPFRYEIPVSLRGKRAELKIVQASSLGPIFGDTAHFDIASKHMSWRNTPSTTSTLFGFTKVSWLLMGGEG